MTGEVLAHAGGTPSLGTGSARLGVPGDYPPHRTQLLAPCPNPTATSGAWRRRIVSSARMGLLSQSVLS